MSEQNKNLSSKTMIFNWIKPDREEHPTKIYIHDGDNKHTIYIQRLSNVDLN